MQDWISLLKIYVCGGTDGLWKYFYADSKECIDVLSVWGQQNFDAWVEDLSK